ncbi:MAG: anti-sigma factor [Cyanobacteria bacterium P01_H01_bin.15]
MDNFPAERYELLSAYVDGEVSVSERRQVQHWLDSDPQVRKYYQHLLQLRQRFNRLAAPEPVLANSEFTSAVWSKIDGQTRRRRIVTIGGGLAAAVVAGLALLTANRTPQFAAGPEAGESLMIAINQPVVEIPPALLEKSEVNN